MLRLSHRQTSLLLGLLALASRLACIAAVSPGRGIERDTDAVVYDAFARQMQAGWDWLTLPLANREPLYPALMAFAYGLPGSDFRSLQIVQALLGSLAVVLIYLALSRLTCQSVAVTAGVLLALNPHFVYYSALPLRENLVIPLLALVVFACLACLRTSGEKVYIFLAAAAFALLIHTDARFLPLAILVPLLIWPPAPSARTVLRGALRILLLLGILMIPYQIRASLALGRPVLVTERVLEKFVPWGLTRLTVQENEQETSERLRWLAAWETSREARLDSLSSAERQLFLSGARPPLGRIDGYRFNFKEYWRFSRTSPEYSPYPEGRFEKTWSRKHNLVSLLTLIPFLVLLPFLWIGAPRLERRLATSFVIFILAHMTIHILVLSTERYRVPMELLMMVLVAMAIVNVGSAVAHVTRRRAWTRR